MLPVARRRGEPERPLWVRLKEAREKAGYGGQRKREVARLLWGDPERSREITRYERPNAPAPGFSNAVKLAKLYGVPDAEFLPPEPLVLLADELAALTDELAELGREVRSDQEEERELAIQVEAVAAHVRQLASLLGGEEAAQAPPATKKKRR